MKRTNPIVLRLGFKKNWDNNINVLNYEDSIPFLLKSGDYLYNYTRALKLSKGSFFFIPVHSTAIISERILYLNFFYCFVNRIIIFQKRKKFILLNSSFFFNRILNKIENLFWNQFKLILKIRSFNYYRQLLLNPFLKQTSILLAKNNDSLQNLSHLFLIALYFKNAFFFSYLVSIEIKKKKHHFRTIGFLSEIISSVFLYMGSIQCLVVQISGRLNNKDKSQTKILNFGNTSVLQTFNINVSYGYTNVVTPIGVFGIRCWIY